MKTPAAKTVGAYEAKTHLPALLAQVERGREIIITRRQKPVARLVPVAPVGRGMSRKEIVAWMRTFRERHALPRGETTRDLVEAGRRI